MKLIRKEALIQRDGSKLTTTILFHLYKRSRVFHSTREIIIIHAFLKRDVLLSSSNLLET